MALNPQEITAEMKKCINGDGHTIYDPKYYTDAGWSKAVIEPITRGMKSDGTHKGNIYGSDGKVIPYIEGVYSLDFHRKIANLLGCRGSDKMGRGFQAQELAQQILEKI